MRGKLQKLVLMLAILVVFLNTALPSINVALSEETGGGNIDLFTQKEPYDGRGLGTPSDAFGPGEQIKIYALVTYNGFPAQSLVAFVLVGPPNSAANVTLYRSAFTNESGIAETSVRISFMNVSTFGEWRAIGNTRIGDATVQDLLTFKVGWIVEIISLRTLDEDNFTQNSFARGRNVGVEVILRNIAMTEKVATITVTMYDGLNVTIDSKVLNGFVVQPNDVPVLAYFLLFVPLNATMGSAVVYADAYTAPVQEGGISYCPEVSKGFFIVERDVAVVSVKPSATFIERGETVYVEVTVANQGDRVESVVVSAHANGTMIDSEPLPSLQPLSKTNITIAWNTSSTNVGVYQISGSVSAVSEEIDISNNNLNDGFVQIVSNRHDIAVVNVAPSDSSVNIGDTLDINVSVKNEGTYTESFNATAYYNSSVIGTIQVQDLEPEATRILLFRWSTEDVATGNYTLKASASELPGEKDVQNNYFIDGFVEVKYKTSPPILIHDVAVLNVVPAGYFVYISDALNVSVTVKNKGDHLESFSVFLYYNNPGNPAAPSILVSSLPANTEKTITFRWSTRGLHPGNYTLIGHAETVQGETNTADNTFADGIVKLATPTGGLFGLDWFWTWLFLILLLILLVILIIFMLYRRRKKRKNHQVFVSGWTAWYFRRNLQHRRHRRPLR
jgi:hypothetical protein